MAQTIATGLRGRIKHFNRLKALGYIIPGGGGDDVLFSANKVFGNLDDVTPGMDVIYDVYQTCNGARASAVHLPRPGVCSCCNRPYGEV